MQPLNCGCLGGGMRLTFWLAKHIWTSETVGFLRKARRCGGLRLSELTSNTYLPQHGKATPLPTFQWGKIQSWLRAWPKQLPSLDHWFYSSPRPRLSKIITIWEAGKLPHENELGGPRLVSHGQVSAPQNHSHNCCQLLVGSKGRSSTAWAVIAQVAVLGVLSQG